MILSSLILRMLMIWPPGTTPESSFPQSFIVLWWFASGWIRIISQSAACSCLEKLSRDLACRRPVLSACSILEENVIADQITHQIFYFLSRRQGQDRLASFSTRFNTKFKILKFRLFVDLHQARVDTDNEWWTLLNTLCPSIHKLDVKLRIQESSEDTLIDRI